MWSPTWTFCVVDPAYRQLPCSPQSAAKITSRYQSLFLNQKQLISCSQLCPVGAAVAPSRQEVRSMFWSRRVVFARDGRCAALKTSTTTAAQTAENNSDEKPTGRLCRSRMAQPQWLCH